MSWRPELWLTNTFAALLARQKPRSYWQSELGQAEIVRLLRSDILEEIARGVLTIGGQFWTSGGKFAGDIIGANPAMIAGVERHLFQNDPAIVNASVWTWIVAKNYSESIIQPSARVLDQFLLLWMTNSMPMVKNSAAYALLVQGVRREEWTPVLSDSQKQVLTEAGSGTSDDGLYEVASFFVAFYAKDIWPDSEIADRLGKYLHGATRYAPYRTHIRSLLEQMGEMGRAIVSKDNLR